MFKMTLLAMLASAAIAVAGAGTGPAQGESAPKTEAAIPAPTKSGHVAINGVNYYYAIRGKGEPLLLLHGGLGLTEMFGPVLTTLAEGREVIGVDLQGHGRTPLGNRPIQMEAMGADMAALVKALGYDKVDVLGYSMGGWVGLHMAAQHPETVRRLVLVSTPYAKNGFYADILGQQAMVGSAMADAMKNTPMFKSYEAVAPSVAEFPKLLDAVGDFMRRDYDWSAEIPKLTMPVMLVYGDGDMIRPEHMVAFYQLLGGGKKDAGWMRESMPKNRLAILPNQTHYDIGVAPALARTVLPFLNGEDNTKSWADHVKTGP